jgi:DNA-binding response OmpR family regulator
MKILLIEDDAIIGDAVKSSLEKADYVVEWAKNGLEGEIALTDSQFEAVILE